MIFTNDTEASLGFAAALADTVPEASDSGDDELSTPARAGRPARRVEILGPT